MFKNSDDKLTSIIYLMLQLTPEQRQYVIDCCDESDSVNELFDRIDIDNVTY